MKVAAGTKAETILFLVFYAPTIDNREAPLLVVACLDREFDRSCRGRNCFLDPVHLLRYIHEGSTTVLSVQVLQEAKCFAVIWEG